MAWSTSNLYLGRASSRCREGYYKRENWNLESPQEDCQQSPKSFQHRNWITHQRKLCKVIGTSRSNSKFTLGQSDKASYRESDYIKFIYFYQMDGLVIWIYAFFFFLVIVCENKIWTKLISLTNFNATLSTIIKQLSLDLLGIVEAFKEIICHYFEMHSLITPVPCNGEAGW